MTNKAKAYILFSGGLDSILAVKLLQNQNVDVCVVCFESNFYNAEVAKKSAEILGVELKVINIAECMINLVKDPPHGLGKNMNPCIDCHGLMIHKVKELFIDNSKQKAFIATGEVLGQRPFSQNFKALREVINIAGCDILRPLSAKLLPITNIEKEGIIDREKLEDIQGRTRKRQMELAGKYNIKVYPSPSGGCILTDPEYGKRLKELYEKWPEFISDDAEIIKHGRVFWLLNNEKWVLIVVGRNKEECEKLVSLSKKKDYIIELKNNVGPTALVRNFNYKIIIKNLNNIKIPNTLNEIIPIQFQNINKKNEVVKTRDEVLKTILQLTGYYKTEARGKMIDFKIIYN